MQVIYSGDGDIKAIYRLGISFVNWYLMDTDEGITIVDAGFPGHWRYLKQALSSINRSLIDIKAIILTHAHSDHVGFAEKARKELNIPIWIHTQDADSAQNAHYPIPKAFLKNMWRPRLIQKFMSETVNGALSPKKIEEVKLFNDGDYLSVPGQPQVIHVPGHTPGSVCFYFEEIQVLISGDSIATRNPMTLSDMKPDIIPMGTMAEASQSYQSLHKIGQLKLIYLLSGHGAPWYGNIGNHIQSLIS